MAGGSSGGIGGSGLTTPFALGGSGSGFGPLIGLPQAGSVSPEEKSWVNYMRGENTVANAQAFSPGMAASTGHTQADIGAEAGSVLQTMRINDAMASAAQEFAAAQEAALGAALGGAGSALGGIGRLAKGGI